MNPEQPPRKTPFEQNNELSEEQAKIVHELTQFSVNKDNPIFFEEFGLIGNREEMKKNIRIKEEILKDLNEEEREELLTYIEILLSFIQKPVFTDNFERNPEARNAWKEIHIPILEKTNPEAFEYWRTNLLRGNMFEAVAGILTDIPNVIKNVKNDFLIKEVSEFKEKIPKEVMEEGTGKAIKKGVNQDSKLYILSGEEKVEVIKKLRRLASEAIALFTE